MKAVIEKIIRDILGLKEEDSLDRSFVELGGQSILATQIQMTIYKETKSRVKISDFYKFDTVNDLIDSIKTKQKKSGRKRKHHIEEIKAFKLKDMQKAYLIGRKKDVGLGGEATHAYCEMEVSDYDHEKFTKAVNKLIQTHEVLRYRFYENGTQELVEGPVEVSVPFTDIQNLSDEKKAEYISYKRSEVFNHKFQMDTPPLVYFEATRIRKDQTIIHFCHDGLVVDGWSHENIVKDLDYYYSNPEVEVRKLDCSYRKYCEYLENMKESEIYQLSHDYWMNWADNMPGNPQLPFVNSPDNVLHTHTRQVLRTFSKKEYEQIVTIAKEWDVSAFSILLTLYGMSIARCSENQHFLLNVPMALRPPIFKDIWDMVGECSNFMLFDFDNQKGESIKEFVIRNNSRILELLDYAVYSGIELLSELQKKKGQRVSVPVVFTSTLDVPYRESEKIVKTYTKTHTSQVWIDAVLMHRQNDVIFTMDCVEEIIPAEVAEEIADLFILGMRELLEDNESWTYKKELSLPDKVIKEIQPCTRKSMSSDLTVGQLLKGSFDAHKDKIHLYTEEATFRYGDSWRIINHINNEALKNGIGPKDTIGIYTGKGVEGVWAELACAVANIVFLPFDTALPQKRLLECIENNNIKAIYTDESHYKYIRDIYTGTVLVVPTHVIDEKEDCQEIYHPAEGKDISYVINTSGTTGLPKSIRIKNAGFAECLTYTNNQFNITAEDNAIAITSLCHDMSLYDVFGMSIAGGGIVIPTEEKSKDPMHWKMLMEKYPVTIWNSVPAFMDMYVSYGVDNTLGLDKVRYIFLGGDWVKPELIIRARRMFANAVVVSVGGPSETTLWNISHVVKDEDLKNDVIPYGKPFPSARYLILNDNMEICPVQVPGTMYVEGICVADGYAGNSEETEKKFVEWNGKRIYNTGDRGAYTKDGEIIFLGRTDSQVKINGKRIELSAIENEFDNIKGIRNCAIVYDKGKQVLMAFYVSEENLMEQFLRQEIKKCLPDYMVPSLIQRVDRMPLTMNGKIDRKRLIEMASEENAVEGKSKCDNRFLQVCKKVFGMDNIKEESNFYEIGGNSITAIKLIAEIRKEYGIDLSIYQIMNTQRLAEIHTLINERDEDSKETREKIETGSKMTKEMPDGTLTRLQEDIWVYENINNNARYVITAYMDLHGSVDCIIDVDRLKTVIELVYSKNDILQKIFLQKEDGLPTQVNSSKNIQVQYVEIADLKKVDEVQKILSEEKMDLAHGPLFKAAIIKCGDNAVRILLSIHHILADEQTFRILFQQIFNEYHNKKVSYDPQGFLKYIALKQQEARENKSIALDNLKAYKNPLKVDRYNKEHSEDNIFLSILPDAAVNKANEIATVEKTSLFTVLLWSFMKVLSERFGEDIYVSVPVSDRAIGDFDHTTGLFLDKVFVKSADRITDVKGNLLKAYEQMHGSYVGAVKKHNLMESYKSIHNGFIFNMIDNTVDNDFGEMHYVMNVQENSDSDLQMLIEKSESGYFCRLSSGAGIFTKTELATIFKQIITSVNSLDKAVDAEMKKSDTLIDMFLSSCANNPHGIALIDRAGKISYGQLYFDILRCAETLIKSGVCTGDFVAIRCNQNKETITWIYAILAVGGVYVPIDYSQPIEKTRLILSDCKAKYFMTDEVADYAGTVTIPLCLTDKNVPFIGPKDFKCRDKNQLAYVMYTSGTTGTPKGVPIKQEGIVNLIKWYTDEMEIGQDSKLILLNNFGFDGAVKHLFAALSCGASLCLTKNELYDVGFILKTISQEKITHVATVPALLREMVIAAGENAYMDFESVTHVVCGGERLDCDIFEKWMNAKNCRAKFYNVYGPAESSCVSLFHQVSKEDLKEGKIPLGTAIRNKKIYLLDENGAQCKKGEMGVLFVGGIGNFDSYLGRTASQSNLIEYPKNSGEMVYRTGDRAILNDRNQYEFKGREDFQIKINGQRVETEEIESVFLNLSKVKQCAFKVESRADRKILVMYYVPQNTEQEKSSEFYRDMMRDYLSESILPQEFVAIAEMPLNNNGKVDRKRLSRSAFSNKKIGRRNTKRRIRKVREDNNIYQKVEEAWKETLNLNEISRDKGFQELGGTSLLFFRLQQEVNNRTGKKISINAILSHPTIASMAEYVMTL